MPQLTITIPGIPIAKKRPRFARRGNFTVAYSDQQTEEGRVLWEIKRQLPSGWESIEAPMTMQLYFFMPIPKSASKKNAILMAENCIKHTKKPDLDNLIKFYKDCMNGTVYKDDSQCWEYQYATKKHSNSPRTDILIRW